MRLLQLGLGWLGVALFWGAVLSLSACARPGSPSGGPRDQIPPMISATWPDTFQVIEATRDPVKITFNERISERPTQGTMDNAVLVSPVTGAHKVKQKRSELEISVIGGFRAGLVYRVRVLPTVKDLFNNTLEGPFELVFSTGGAFETNVIAGIVKDRITRKAVEGVRVEAREQEVEDPPVYVAATDSAGVFALRYLPAGSYAISLYQDVNRNLGVDFSEPQGDTVGVVGLQPPMADTVLFREVAILRPDTTPARLIRAEAMDSVHLRLAFDDFLDAESAFGPVLVRIAPEEGPALQVDQLLWLRQVDSIRAVADSVAAEERRVAMVDSLGILVDSLGQIFDEMLEEGDSLGLDSLGARLVSLRERMAPPEPPALRERPGEGPPPPPPPILPQQEFYVLLAEPLIPDTLLTVTVTGLANINGLGGGGGEATFTWEPPDPPPDERPDTAGLVPDTAGAPPDTGRVVPPDTVVAPPDTSGVPPDTGRVVLSEADRSTFPWWLIRRRP